MHDYIFLLFCELDIFRFLILQYYFCYSKDFLFSFAVHEYFFVSFSDILDYSNIILPTDSTGKAYYPPIYKPKGIFLLLEIYVQTLKLFEISFLKTVNHNLKKTLQVQGGSFSMVS